MNDFDFDQPKQQKASVQQGDWHVLLTVMSILIVGGLSFLMAYLTRDVAERSLWLMGLIFVVPVAAMLLANLLVEFKTNAMTPRYIRGKQVVIAAIVIVATFLVGCLCDAIYLGSYVEPVRSNTIFVLDKSTSMDDYSFNGKTMDIHCNNAVISCLESMPPTTEVGMVLFCNIVLDEEPMKPLSEPNHMARLREMANSGLAGATDFYSAMNTALKLVRNSGSTSATQIVFVTDGADPTFKSYADSIAKQCNDLNVRVDVIGIDSDAGSMLPVVRATGGTIQNVTDVTSLSGVMSSIAVKDMDMLRVNDKMANRMTGIMFVLEGIVLGLGLWLMFSVHGQLRFQMILSPLMGVLGLVVLKYMGYNSASSSWWVIEGLAFSLLGVVFMRRNRINHAAMNRLEVTDVGTNDAFDQSGSFDF